jgi:hypothetical protein
MIDYLLVGVQYGDSDAPRTVFAPSALHTAAVVVLCTVP